jgi:Fe-S cluster assembly scaffold protein SufB
MNDWTIKAGEKSHIVLVHHGSESEQRVIRLAGEGAEVVVDEIFMSGNVRSQLTIVHDARRTKSRVNARGVVGKAENTVSHAKVVIPKHGQLSDSFVEQKFLLLDGSAQAEAVPSLEIEADEVKASHSATISPLDAEKMFYLASRGVSDSEARKLIIEGFLKLPEGHEHLLEKWQT